MPTRKITRVFRRPGDAGRRQPPRVSESASLVDFLNAMEQSKLSLLPIASQRGLPILGRGLSGWIRQSTADVATVLAFKEGVPSKQDRDTEEEQDWYSLMTEVTVLQHPPIRANPHFMDVLGVSLYVEPASGPEKRAWPLLVTSKINRGDLTVILRTEQQGLLTDQVRMQLFAETAEAVYVLHACGVAHGDIKPDNFLIHESEKGDLNCLLIDFGSSTIQGQKRLPTINEPWNAPELEGGARVVGFDELVQNDIFSFGLVCLHLLLPLDILESANLCLIRRSGQSDDQWAQFIHQMKILKEAQTGATLATQIFDIIKKCWASTHQKHLLRMIVASTIQPPASRRRLPWAELLPHIRDHMSYSFAANLNVPVTPPPLTYSSVALDHSKHSIFDLALTLGDLDDTDYVLGANIIHDLAYKAENSACISCRKEYAFRIAVCRTIGFGCRQENDTSQHWLVKACKTQDELDSAVRKIGNVYRVPGRVDQSVLDALGIGVLVSADRTEEYRLSRRLSEAENTLKNAIEARARVFGRTHPCLAKVSSELSLVLSAQNRLPEAEKYQQDAVEILSQHFGEDHPSPLLAKITLAGILADQGSVKRALGTQKAVQPALTKVLGKDHPDTITALQILGNTLAELGELKEAEQITREVISIRNRVLTPRHPLTVRGELSLVAILRGQGLLKQASGLMENIDARLSTIVAGDYLTRAQLCVSQAELYKDLMSLDRAVEKVKEAMVAIDRLMLPEDDKLRLAGLQVLASTYGAGREYDKEEAILRQILDARRSLNERDREVSTTKCLLAENLLSQTRLDEAYAIADEVVTVSGISVTEDPQNHVACVNVLATVLSFQGKRKDAEEMRQQIFESCKAEFGESHIITLNVAQSLGMSYSEEGFYDKAQQHYEQILGNLRASSHPGINAVKVAGLLAIAYREHGRYEKAKAQCEEAISWATKAVGEKHIEALAVYRVLLSIYANTGMYLDAEELYTTRLVDQCKGTHLEMYVKNDMAQLRRRQGRYQEAARFQSDAHELMKLTLGSLHPELIKMRSNVLGDDLREAESLTPELEKEVLENIELKKQILGVCHPSTIITMSDLAYAYGEHGRLEDSENLFDEIQKIGGREALQDPQKYATLLGRWADAYFRMGRLERAEELERKGLSVRQQIFGDDHIAVLTSMSNLASTLHAQSKYDEAEKCLRHVVAVRESSPLEDMQSIFRLLKSKVALGAVLFANNKLQESLPFYLEAVGAATQIGLPATIVDVWKADLQEVLKTINEMTDQMAAGHGTKKSRVNS